MKKLLELDIVLTVYNQEALIQRVLYGIFFHTTTPFTLILVFDGCTDNSEKNARKFIERFRPKNLQRIIIKYANGVYETKANNIGFREATQRYLITLQDDMVIREAGWERRLTFPLRLFDDVVAVTAEEARDVHRMSFHSEVFKNRASHELGTPKHVFAIRDIINRGPIAFRVDYLKKLHYLDEIFAPCEYDEADLCLRAWQKYKWKVGVFWIDYQSKPEWSKSLAADSTMGADNSRKKNRAIIGKRHRVFLSGLTRHTKDIVINDEDIDYIKKAAMPNYFIRLLSYITCHSARDIKEFLSYLLS